MSWYDEKRCLSLKYFRTSEMSEDSCFKVKKVRQSYWNRTKCDTASTLNVQNTKNRGSLYSLWWDLPATGYSFCVTTITTRRFYNYLLLIWSALDQQDSSWQFINPLWRCTQKHLQKHIITVGVSQVFWYFVVQYFLEPHNLHVSGVGKESSLSTILLAQAT